MKRIIDIFKNLYKDNKGIVLIFICIILAIVIFSLKTNFVTEEQIKIDDFTFENQQEELLGGWKEEKDGTISNGLKKIFEDATKSDDKNTYEPIKFLASQVVAGFNYKYLANVINKDTGEEMQCYVYIFTNLEGVSSLINVFPVNN